MSGQGSRDCTLIKKEDCRLFCFFNVFSIFSLWLRELEEVYKSMALEGCPSRFLIKVPSRKARVAVFPPSCFLIVPDLLK